MSYEGDMRQIISRAESQGFRYERTNGNHHRFLAPDGKGIVVTSATPGDQTGFLNFKAELKRAGYSDEDAPRVRTPGGTNLTTGQLIIDFLARHPEGAWMADVTAYILSLKPNLGKSAPAQSMAHLIEQNKAEKDAAGKYRLAPIMRPAPAPPPKPVEVKADVETLNADAAALDAAMDAIMENVAKIQGIVQRNKSVLTQLDALKKLLGGGGEGK